MSAERGWIGEPQPARQWHDSHYSRQADRIAASAQEPAGLNRRYAHLHTPKHLTNPDHKGWVLTGQRIGRHRYQTVMAHVTNPDHYVPSSDAHGGPPLILAPQYAAGRPRQGR